LQDPKQELSSLVQKGRSILGEVQAVRSDAITLNPKLSAGGAILSLLGVEGRRTVVSFGRYIGSSGLATRTNAVRSAFLQWHSEVLEKLRRISVIRGKTNLRENSAVLTRRFARTRTYRRLDTQIAHAVGELESILEEDLVYNEQISEILRTQEDKRLLDISGLSIAGRTRTLLDREHLRTALVANPRVLQMLEGALDTYSLGGRDANRQSLASCRSALELLVTQITGQANWREGLASLVEGSKKKLVSQTYGFLSGYGSHPGRNTSRKDAALGIRMAIATCLWLAETPDKLPSSVLAMEQ